MKAIWDEKLKDEVHWIGPVLEDLTMDCPSDPQFVKHIFKCICWTVGIIVFLIIYCFKLNNLYCFKGNNTLDAYKNYVGTEITENSSKIGDDFNKENCQS